jgi:large subunit ribosomal protein L13
MIVIDASNLIVGRMATVIAKKSLLGEEINVVNCENAVMTGKKKEVFERMKVRNERGDALKGPYFQKMPDRFIRRIIRGMLPYKQEKGKLAYKRVMCYIGVPDQFNDKKLETIKSADVSNSQALSYVTVGKICNFLKK